jgi:hypothetical protein
MDQSIYFSIDVECVATGTDHNSRAVAQISLVVSFPILHLNKSIDFVSDILNLLALRINTSEFC